MKSERRSCGQKGALRFLHDRRGAVGVLFAVLLTTLFGFAGLGVDVGLWYTLKRQYQSAADIAALSGAMELEAGKGLSNPQGQASTDIQNLAQYAAQDNMTSGSAGNLTVATTTSGGAPCISPPANQICVNNGPQTPGDPLYNNSDYVEAIIGEPGTSIFPGFVGYTTPILIRTRAVAGLKHIQTCMLALNTTGTDLGFNGGGSGAGLQIPNCSFVSDSTTTTPPAPQNQNSIVINGNVTINAGAINTSGNYTITGTSNSVSPPIATGTPYAPDPYATQVTSLTFPWSSSPAVPPNSGCISVTSGQTVTLQPGWYGLGGPNCPNGNSTPPVNLAGGTTTLCPGVYYVTGEDNKGEGFVISNAGTVVQMGTAGANGCPANGFDGVTIVTTCNTNSADGGTPNCTSGGGFVIGGTGSNNPTVTLSAPCIATGDSATCAGAVSTLLFYQVASTADTSQNNGGNTILAGSGGANLAGAIYTPATQIRLQGNPNFTSCLELVAGSYSIGGTPTFAQPPTNCNLSTDSATRLVLAE